MPDQTIKLQWWPTEPDGFGEWTYAASAAGVKFTLYPGSIFTLTADDATSGKRLWHRKANTPGALKAAATKYVKAVR